MKTSGPDPREPSARGSSTEVAVGADLRWRASPHEGVEWKKLHFDGQRSVVLLRFAPGACYGAHRHPRGEEYFVLEGSLLDGGEVHRAGTWIAHPPGSAHRPSSPEGCVLLVRLDAPIDPIGDPVEGSDPPDGPGTGGRSSGELG
ncbi:MAG: cupin domain-containing protein [Planctomycetota bacterium]